MVVLGVMRGENKEQLGHSLEICIILLSSTFTLWVPSFLPSPNFSHIIEFHIKSTLRKVSNPFFGLMRNWAQRGKPVCVPGITQPVRSRAQKPAYPVPKAHASPNEELGE